MVFTSVARALRVRDRRLVGQTYLWMLPIYGAGGLLLERLHARLVRRGVSPPLRALVSTAAILAWEYGTGSVLRRALGDCPWRYRRGVTLRGYVRLDYAPYWYATALLFELLQREVRKLDRARRTAERRASRGEAEDLDAEARRAAAELRSTLGTPPRLDLVLLGLGPDGHICSLFAGVPGSAERGDEELVRHVRAPERLDPRLDRLTLTPFLIVTARNVVLQVAGEQKAAVLARALKGPEDLVACPAQWLRRAAGRVVIGADAAAAAKL